MAQKVVVVDQSSVECCEALEAGNILVFPSIPFQFPQEEIAFLLKQRQGGSAARKNIAYKPQIDQITNHESKVPGETERLKEILRNYSTRVTEYLTVLLEPYASGWKHDYASFRPFQEKGRNLRLRARNDLLHVDSFPTRPMHGARILRFFTNINPTEGRHWITSKGFTELAAEFGGKNVAFPKAEGFFSRKLKKFFKWPLRSPYDHFMLNLHNFLKENESFQKECPKDQWVFPPNSCWAVFTDEVSHAALAGQYALEQTFIIPRDVLLCPDKAPVSLLERLSGRSMVDTESLAAMFPASS